MKTELEEAAESCVKNEPNEFLKLIIKYSFKEGAKWQQERMYSEEEVIKLLIYCKDRFADSELYHYSHDDEVKKWFEKFKKK